MRKFILCAIVACAAIAILALAGCGSKYTRSNKNTEPVQALEDGKEELKVAAKDASGKSTVTTYKVKAGDYILGDPGKKPAPPPATNPAAPPQR